MEPSQSLFSNSKRHPFIRPPWTYSRIYKTSGKYIGVTQEANENPNLIFLSHGEAASSKLKPSARHDARDIEITHTELPLEAFLTVIEYSQTGKLACEM